jgi:hypothetical protein
MYWHSFECSNPKCTRPETGMIMDIRTESAEQPKGVKCPYCQRYPCYRAFWTADESGFGSTSDGNVSVEALIRVLRKTSLADLQTVLREVKIGDEWQEHKNNDGWSIFAYGNPFEEIARVVREEDGSWSAFAGKHCVLRCADPDMAKQTALTYLSTEHNYVFPV